MPDQPSDLPPSDENLPKLSPGEETPDASPADEGLPAWEPLTPELVEDESIRGDFVMKWAVVMLAFLLASTLIGESTTLVHVKTGQYLAAHGVLPPATDVLSNPADGRPWTNLSWFFDLLAAGVYGVGSWIGLGAAKAILAGITVGLLVHICRPEVSTWWGSICAALTVLVCQPRFTAQPELITLLGLALLLWLLHTWQLGSDESRIWWLIPTFLVWSNLDERMFLGLALVLLYTAGEACGQLVGVPGLKSAKQRRHLWMALGLSCVAAMVHPFTWKWLLSPAALFGTTYPAMRTYGAGPSIHPFYLPFFPTYNQTALLNAFGRSAVALAMLWVATLVTMLLNRKRLDLGHLFVFIGFSVLAVLFIHEWAAAAVVFCVLATLNGQIWHSAMFSRTYSVETQALIFSRGGRAATVLGLFAIALLAVADRWRGASDAALGYGLDPALSSLVESFQTQLKETFDDRPFNYVLNQGDVLIWIGKKPFIDHRLALYAGIGSNDLIALHKQVRMALRSKRTGEAIWGEKYIWKDAFNKYSVTYVLPRLTFAPRPDYPSMSDLRNSPDWELASISPVTAVFYRKDLKNPELAKFVAEHKEDFEKLAFREEASRVPPRDGWVQPPSFYQKYIWGTRSSSTGEVDEAVHLVQFAAGSTQSPLSLVYLAIRKAQQGLAKNRNDAKGYAVLGDAYSILAATERRWSNPQQKSDVANLRYFEAVMSYNQALTAAPQSDAAPHEALLRLYASSQKWDLAARELKAIDQRLSQIKNPSKDEEKKIEENRRLQERLEEKLRSVDDAAAKLEENGQPAGQIIAFFLEQGCVLRALQRFGEAGDLLGPDPNARQIRAMLLIEAGQVEEAYTVAGLLEATAAETGFQDWQMPRMLTFLANAEYDRATQLLIQESERIEKNAILKILIGLPAVSLPQVPAPWPLNEISGAFDYLFQMPTQTASRTLAAAILEVETGEVGKAEQHFHKVLALDPETTDRTLVAIYLLLLNGEENDLLPPSQMVPVLFEPDEA